MKAFRWSLVSRAAMMAVSLSTTAARADSLADAIALAYRTNPSLQANRYDLRSTDETYVQALSELRPTATVEVTGRYDRTIEGRATRAANPFSLEARNQNSNEASLVVNQPFYTGGRATADVHAAEAGIQAARASLRVAEGDLLLQVISAYVSVRHDGTQIAILKASLGELERIEAEVRARQVAGELTRTDVAQTAAQLETARTQIADAEQQLEASRAAYAALVGQNPGTLLPEPPLPHMPQSIDLAFDLATQSNPEIIQARYTEFGSREQIIAARANGRPTLSLRGTAQLSGGAIPYRLHDQDQEFIGEVVFTQPLSAGGRTASLIRQAGDKNSSDRLKIEAARRTAIRAVAGAWNQMVTAQRNQATQTRQRDLAAIQLDGMISEYRVGLRSTFDVLYAQQTFRDAQITLLDSERDLYVGQASLLRQVGLLEARALMTDVPLYDPAEHLRHVEHKNALPWMGAIRAVDALAKPASHQQVVKEPGVAARPVELAPPHGVVPSDLPLATNSPMVPILDPVTARAQP